MRDCRRFFCVAVAVALVGALVFSVRPLPVRADASPALKSSLRALRNLNDYQFGQVVSWAQSYAAPPNFATSPVEQAEIQIGNLHNRDQQAILSWLRGNGRGALYAQGATDDQIGGRSPGQPVPTSTPNPYRELPLTTSTLGPTAAVGNIQILGGFAAAKRDGTSAIACVSFQNVGTIAATRVDFSFPLIDLNGDTVGTMHLERVGTFSPGIGIMTYSSFSTWNAGNGASNKGYANNCATVHPGLAALPILSARYASYTITHVDYANGTSWSPAPTTSRAH